MSNQSGTVYDEKFYEGQRERSSSSARCVLPVITDLVSPKSVLDVGCGVGTWVKAWVDAGLDDVLGVDGDYVDRDSLACPSDKFHSHDLNAPLFLGRHFDLVSCLEVAEHLPDTSAAVLVQSLVRHGDVVMFSAAVPRQGGTHHVNEQWPSYWAKHFLEFGYDAFDIVRPEIWDNDGIEWWYRQNILLFASKAAADRLGFERSSMPLDIVHPMFLTAATEPVSLPTQLWEKVRDNGRKLAANTRVEKQIRRLRAVLS